MSKPVPPAIVRRGRKPGTPRVVQPVVSDAVAEATETAVAAVLAVPAVATPAADPHPAPTPEPVIPAPIAATSKQGFDDMATNPTEATQDFTAKAQSAFTDASERAKTAFEKSSRISEDFAELARGNVEAVVASARVVAKGGESIAQEAVEYGKKSFEHAASAFKGFAAAKSPTELFQLQSDFARSAFDQAVAEASRFSETVLKLAGDAAQPLSSRYAVAAEKIKGATL